MSSEIVMCVETKKLKKLCHERGFIPISLFNPESLLDAELIWFGPRDVLEDCDEFLQIIPYIILRHNDSVVLYKRTSVGKEQRLHQQLSIGFGGHVELMDIIMNKEHGTLDVRATIRSAACRELKEEIKHSKIKSKELLGIIYDEGNPVARVHCGIVEIWTLAKPMIKAVERTLSECRFVNNEEIFFYKKKMELWSALCTSIFSSKQRQKR